jgi:guanyl-specific ribonuclease Sa
MVKTAMLVILLAALPPAPAARAQDGNAQATGFGAAVGTVREVQETLNKQWQGTPGRFAKGGIGAYGALLALSAAYDALHYEATINAKGVKKGSSIGGDGAGDGSTSTSTATSSN